MKALNVIVLLMALATVIAGCSDNNFNSGNPPSQAPEVSYTASLAAIEVVNTDTGEPVDVEGLPAVGDEVVKE